MSYLIVNAARSAGTIRKTIYGQFSEHLGRCIYGGIADQDGALRPAVLQALKTLHIPVLRWPGGCFADTYHWRDGIGPRSERKTIINTNWGGVTENNAFGTHEFLSLCEQLGCEAYLSGNVGSGTVQEFSDWVEYCNMPGVSPMADLRRRNGREAPFGVRYWGIGNEAWGCGGTMRAEYYADLCRQYATYLRSYDAGLVPYKIASGANVDDYHWTRTVVERAGQCIDAVSLHYYTVPGPDWQHKGSATDFDRDAYYTTLHKTLRMEELVENHSRIIRRFAKGRPIGLCVDEWGTWYDVEPGTNPGFLYQQNTMRDALVAAVNLNIFNNHCDTVVMANIAQLVNVLQSVILTEGEKMVLTPTYHVFDLYKHHHDATLLNSHLETEGVYDGVPNLTVSASEDENGVVHITLANISADTAYPIDCALTGKKYNTASARILTNSIGAYNDFDHPEDVKITDFDALTLENNNLHFNIPACAVMEITVS